MTSETTLKGIILTDGVWFGAAAMAALLTGVAIDQAFRNPSMGLRYQSAAERILAPSTPSSVPQQAINFVDLEEVEAMLLRRDVIVLDARPRDFYELGHLPGARCLSREELSKDFALLESQLRGVDRELLVYCSDAGCEDSAVVARALQTRGFTRLHLFPGGYAEWEAAGRRVEVSP
jgi:rhodanese-related sulfurtransferase